MKTKFIYWANKEKRIARFEITSLSIPVNVEILDENLISKLKKNQEYDINIFADDAGEFNIYKDEKEYRNQNTKTVEKSLIPIGTFQEDNQEAYAIVSGVVSDIYKDGNSQYIGIEFLTAYDYPMYRYCLQNVEINNVVKGVVWLTAEENHSKQ